MRARVLVLGVAVAGFGCNSILGNSPHPLATGTGGAAGGGGGAAGGRGGGGAAGASGAQGGSTVGGSGGAAGQAGTGGGAAGTGGMSGTGGGAGTGGSGGMSGAGGGTAGRGGTMGSGGSSGTGGGAAGRGGTSGSGGTGGASGTGGGTVLKTLALLAGQLGGPGNLDGSGAAARFRGPLGVAIDQAGNAFVADTGNHTIRRVVLATGAVSTIAGAPGVPGSANGAGAVARFSSPWGLALDTNQGFSTLYIAEAGNHMIRRLDVASNQVSTIAGAAGTPGSTDASGTAARFNSPRALAMDSTNQILYVADSLNNTIRAINLTASNAVTTIAGTASSAGGLTDATGTAARFRLPNDLALDTFGGNLYVSDANNSAIRKIALGTAAVTTLASGSPIAGPSSLAYNGDLYVLSSPSLLKINVTSGATSTFLTPLGSASGLIRFDAGNNLLMTGPDELDKIDMTAKTVSSVAGTTAHLDNARSGLLSNPTVITGNGADLLFVNRNLDYSLQRITVSTGAANTYLGPTCLGSFTGLANARGTTVTAACASSNTIVVMSQTGTGLTNVAGTDFLAGSADGTGTDALFNSPQGLTDDGAGTVYVADASNHTIRKVVVSTGVVTTLAGMAGTPGSADMTGLAASFNGPTAVASDGQGNLYVADAGNHTIRKVVISSKVVSTIAGTAGMAGTGDGAGAAARFVGPTSVVADGAGNLYVSDGNTVRQIVVSTGNVTTLAGVPGRAGVKLGDLPAGLNRPAGMAMLSNGSIAVTETNENAVLLLK